MTELVFLPIHILGCENSFLLMVTAMHVEVLIFDLSTSDLLQGHIRLQPFCPPKPEDVATVCYTSGTTGTPKVAHFKLFEFR